MELSRLPAFPCFSSLKCRSPHFLANCGLPQEHEITGYLCRGSDQRSPGLKPPVASQIGMPTTLPVLEQNDRKKNLMFGEQRLRKWFCSYSWRFRLIKTSRILLAYMCAPQHHDSTVELSGCLTEWESNVKKMEMVGFHCVGEAVARLSPVGFPSSAWAISR